MANGRPITMFGFQISKKSETFDKPKPPQSFSPPDNNDGALTITSAAYYGTYVDLDGTAKNEVELITRYREMAMQPELESAIDDIVNETIVQDDDGKTIDLVLDDLKDVPDNIKKAVQVEFQTVLQLLNYNNMAQDLFRRWYIDGRLFFHIIIDKEDPSKGILELRYIDPRKIRKIRELKKQKDANTGAEIIVVANEYYIYNERSASSGQTGSGSLPGVRIAPDAVLNINSGLMDSRRAIVLSYLHKAIKPLNQLRMVEDATVIYRLSRAPERRIFYIDVGDLPKAKAEQYLYDIQTKYKNKLVYDANTGEIRDDRKHLSMLEDFWLPRRNGSKGTEIDTLSGGENLGVLEDVIYFEKKLYKSLGVPVARLDPNQGFSMGRPTEVTRDEIKFAKFVERLRNKFSSLFDQAMKIQLVLKGICTKEEWDQWKEHAYFDFIKDNYFVELKEGEIMKERLAILGIIDPYTGRYFSADWIRRNVLRMNDDEIKEMKKEIEKEAKEQAENPDAPGAQPPQDPDSNVPPGQQPNFGQPDEDKINTGIQKLKTKIQF